MGEIYQAKKDIQNATLNYKSAIRLYEQGGDKIVTSNYDKAKNYLQKCLV